MITGGVGQLDFSLSKELELVLAILAQLPQQKRVVTRSTNHDQGPRADNGFHEREPVRDG